MYFNFNTRGAILLQLRIANIWKRKSLAKLVNWKYEVEEVHRKKRDIPRIQICIALYITKAFN